MINIKKTLSIFVIIAIAVCFFGCSNNDSKIKNLYIGVTNSDNINVINNYFNEKFTDANIVIVDLNQGTGDTFFNVYNNIKKYIQDKKLDMVIGVPEDYVSSQDQSLFMDISEPVLKNDNILDCVKNHCKSNNIVKYITDSLYCSRFLVGNDFYLNNEIINILDNGFTSVNDLITFFNSKSNFDKKFDYLLSLGSATDEFLYDDIANILTYQNFPRTQQGTQMRFFDDTYMNEYMQLYDLAKKHSYCRKDIGYDSLLDFEFANGNIVYKISSLYELNCFKYGISNAPFNPKITNFSYSIYPIFANILITQSTVTAISDNTIHKSECLKILNYILSEEYGLEVLNSTSPLLIDNCSVTILSTNRTIKLINNLYGDIQLTKYTNYTTYRFIKNEKKHWNIINQEQIVFQEKKGGEEELINALRKIN